MPHEYPDYFAKFYDVIYQRQRNGVDNEFFQKEIMKVKGKVLEIGVGTGRLFVDSLSLGADVYGIDISPSMIGILHKKLKPEQQEKVSLQDILDFHFDFKFDLIIAPFHMFMHVLEKEDQIKAINNVHTHLNENGKFIFDAFVPDLKQLVNRIDNYIDFKGEYEPGKFVKRTVSTRPDLINQIINIKFRMEWDDDNEIKKEDWTFPFRFFFRYELEHLVERTKFNEYLILGDYEGNPLSKESKEFIVVCKKG